MKLILIKEIFKQMLKEPLVPLTACSMCQKKKKKKMNWRGDFTQKKESDLTAWKFLSLTILQKKKKKRYSEEK